MCGSANSKCFRSRARAEGECGEVQNSDRNLLEQKLCKYIPTYVAGARHTWDQKGVGRVCGEGGAETVATAQETPMEREWQMKKRKHNAV